MPSKRDDITARRTKVAEMLLARKTQMQMADELGVGQATINRDVKAIRKEWHAERMQDLEEYIADDLARLAAAEAAMWPLVIAGKPHAVDRLLSIMDRRAKLLGMDAPQRVDISHALRDEALKFAAQYGLDPDEVLAEANAILKATR